MITPNLNFFSKLRNTYHHYPRQFWLVAAGVLLSSAGSSLIWPFQLIYISKTLTLPISSVATLISISSLTGLLASFVGGAIADRFGRKLIMFIAQVSHGLAYIMMSRANTYVGFIIPMTIMGIAMPFYSIGSDAMMADIIPSEKRTSAFAILRMINNAGIAIGPAIGGLIVASSYTTAFYLAAGGMLSYSLLLITSVRETLQKKVIPAIAQKKEMLGGYGRVLSDGGFVAFVSAITVGMIAPLMMWILLAVYINKYYGIPEYLYSWMPITNAMMCVFVQYPVTMFTRKMRAKTAITLGMFVYAIGVGSVAVMTGFWGFWLSMVIMSMGELILVPTGSKYVADIAPEDLRGRYMSIYWLTWGVSRTVAPMVGGYLHDAIAPQAIWWGGLAIGLVSTLGLFLLSRRPENFAQTAPLEQ
ncbi:MAG: MFS transporter [Chloroflexi bacterium]|nr:MFS transporter [Chloroflexota bacterium]